MQETPAKPYRILSLDGGGSWAMIQVNCLMNLYGDLNGHELLRKFDLVVANSGGSMVAGALANDMKLSAIQDIFMNKKLRRQVFYPIHPFGIKSSVLDFITRMLMKSPLGPRYSTEKKFSGLNDILKKHSTDAEGKNATNLKLHELPAWICPEDPHPNFLIIGFDYHQCRADFFRSDINSEAAFNESSELEKNQAENISIVEAMHASSNAPLNYFKKPAQFPYRGYERFYWDGAIGGFNNPVLAAVIEAISNGHAPENIQVLSLGTGSVHLPVRRNSTDQPADSDKLVTLQLKSTFLRDLPKMSTSIVDDPPDSASFITHTILSGPDKINPSFVRMSPIVQPVKGTDNIWHCPEGLSLKEFESIADLDMDAVKQKDVDLLKKLSTLWMQDKIVNQAIRKKGDSLEARIGHSCFSAAKAAWKEIDPRVL